MSEIINFGYKPLPKAWKSDDYEEFSTVINSTEIATFSKLSTREKFAHCLAAGLETQYRILMMPPQTLEIVKLQSLIAKHSIEQAINLGEIAEKRESSKIAEIVKNIRDRIAARK